MIAVDDHDNLSVQDHEFVVDTVPPTVTISGVSPGGVYVAGAEPEPGCTAGDVGSGLVGPCSGTATAPPGGVGTWTYTATAADLAGNVGTASVSWTVIWPFAGFFDPVVNPPDVLVANAGRAVPVKFSLGGDRGLGVIAPTYPRSGPMACDANGDLVELTETATPGSSGLSYDASTGTYTYVWQTDKSWAGGCRQFTLRLIDGTEHRFVVQLL